MAFTSQISLPNDRRGDDVCASQQSRAKQRTETQSQLSNHRIFSGPRKATLPPLMHANCTDSRINPHHEQQFHQKSPYGKRLPLSTPLSAKNAQKLHAHLVHNNTVRAACVTSGGARVRA